MPDSRLLVALQSDPGADEESEPVCATRPSEEDEQDATSRLHDPMHPHFPGQAQVAWEGDPLHLGRPPSGEGVGVGLGGGPPISLHVGAGPLRGAPGRRPDSRRPVCRSRGVAADGDQRAISGRRSADAPLELLEDVDGLARRVRV